MSSREEILSAVRSHLPESAPLPELDGPWIEYPDPLVQFASVLEMIGGRCLRVPTRVNIAAELAQLPAWSTAKQTLSTLPEVSGTVTLSSIDDPHALEAIDFAVLEGQVAVAENAAIWVTDATVRHRVIYFLCQHLALAVRTADVVHNMHEAYQRLALGQRQFGGFIAGPSKTADIEQSLVIGAHGPRSMTVFLVDA